jgi:hypothetical protein
MMSGLGSPTRTSGDIESDASPHMEMRMSNIDAVPSQQPRPTTNPMVAGSSAEGSHNGDESTVGGGEGGSIVLSSEADDPIKLLHFYRVLFAEDAPRWCQASWCWWRCGCLSDDNRRCEFPRPPGERIEKTVVAQMYSILMRALMFAVLGVTASAFVVEDSPVFQFGVFLPMILATLTCIGSSFVLPSKFKAAAEQVATHPGDDEHLRPHRRLLNVQEINWAGRRALLFSAVWLVLGFCVDIAWVPYNSNLFGTSVSVGYFFRDLVLSCATTPTLGAIFFILALDVARMKKEINILEKSAQDMSLTLGTYEWSQEYIEDVSSGTRTSLLVVAAIAFYNVMGLVWFVYADTEGAVSGDDKTLEVLNDLFWFVSIGKEACLFFVFVYLAMVVNDAADDVCTEVYLWPTTGKGKEGEKGGIDLEAGVNMQNVRQRKFEILNQATMFVGPKERRHRGRSWQRLVAPKAGGIAFRVLGVRWTRGLFVALLLSASASLISGIARNYIT